MLAIEWQGNDAVTALSHTFLLRSQTGVSRNRVTATAVLTTGLGGLAILHVVMIRMNQTITIDLDDQDSRTVRRTTSQPVRSIKAAQSRMDSRVS